MDDKNQKDFYSKEFFDEQLAILKKQNKWIQERIDDLEQKLHKGGRFTEQAGIPSHQNAPQSPSPEKKDAGTQEKFFADAGKNRDEVKKHEPVVNSARIRQSKNSQDMEITFGRFWLNKIGIVIFTVGIGFLISYTFEYFPALLKIFFGYGLSGLLFWLGFRAERKKNLLHFGRVLLGAAWAMMYFTTFAMHHFEASRIIENQFVDIVLLLFVVAGMLIHSIKYRSETMTSLAVFIAYVTATLGSITGFTFMSCLLLSVIILILVHRYQWIKMLFLGVGFTYFFHYLWIIPNLQNTVSSASILGLSALVNKSFLNLVFLSAYGLVFLLGIHLIKSKRNILCGQLAVANVLNFLFFYSLAYPLIRELFYPHRFGILLGIGVFYVLLGLIMKRRQSDKIYISDVLTGVMVATLAVPIRFLPNMTLLIWLIEIPFLLSAGFIYKQKILRVLSYLAFLLFVFRLTLLSIFPETGFKDIFLMGIFLNVYEFLYLAAALVLTACGVLGEKVRRKEGLGLVDLFFNHVFSAFAFFYLFSFLCLVLIPNYFSLGLCFALGVLAYFSVKSQARRLRIYGYLLVPVIIIRSLFIEDYFIFNDFKWLVMSLQILIFFVLYLFYRSLSSKSAVEGKESVYQQDGATPCLAENLILLISGLILLSGLTYKYVIWQWVSLGLGLSGLCIIVMGIMAKDRAMRLGGLLFFGMTLLRVIFVDLSHLDIIYKIISFILIGLFFLMISFIYNHYLMPLKDKDSN